MMRDSRRDGIVFQYFLGADTTRLHVITMTPIPDRVGRWRWIDDEANVVEFDVYETPWTGHLCCWYEEIGFGLQDGNYSEDLYWTDDRLMGHVPVYRLQDEGVFQFVARKESYDKTRRR